MTNERQNEIEGVLLLLKPSGMTAHDVVEFVRKCLKVKRVGHTGTLDPLAAGLMVICLGRATRLAEFLSALDKVYRFETIFGVKTNTQDGEGEIVSVATTDEVTVERLKLTLRSFIGEIQQTPPMMSAVHYQGKRLYTLARKGIEVSRRPRKVKIYRLDLLRFWDDRPKRALLEVHCSSGTYIRTLCESIGDVLGCGAYQSFLIRLSIGPFLSESALTLEEFAEAVEKKNLGKYLILSDQALPMLPALSVNRLDAQKLLNGMEIILGTKWGYPDLQSGKLARLYTPDNLFIGIGEIRQEGNLWMCQPRKMFPLINQDKSS